ncbi:transposase, partial [Lachnoclostridium sp. MSJ-17]|uniref:transposase n=1 Tax=Lachnoclostridium sp. MSJ-17 TaxID=2841516 RepID=UPI001C10119E
MSCKERSSGTRTRIATITNGISNARIEATNNKIKLSVRMAYGFRNIDNLISMIMLRCGGL